MSEKLDHTEIIKSVVVVSYDEKSFAMQMRAAASFIQIARSLDQDQRARVLEKFCASHGWDIQAIYQLITAIQWGGKLEYEEEVRAMVRSEKEGAA